MDYGHPLQSGMLITPVSDAPRAPAERALLSEALGFDLVTFQDHPYQVSFLDTWTLLNWSDLGRDAGALYGALS
jgi:alkanesulfonate monooxygenase SsuD/methylene tetrahydromethanopterin reductase-like flavin-dependent oxidoreductase (luciferase family)